MKHQPPDYDAICDYHDATEASAAADGLPVARGPRRSPWPYVAFQEPAFGVSEISRCGEVITAQRLTAAARVLELEDRMAELAGVRFGVACSSGTAALHLAMLALGLEDVALRSYNGRPLVLVPATTYIATANAVTYCGAVPVPVDVEPGTWTMSPVATARAIERYGERVVGAVAVHLCGVPADVRALRAAIGPHRWLLEDAAQAIGARARTRGAGRAGGFPGSDAGIFSLHGSKPVAAGEGGVLVTDDEQDAERARLYRGQGHTPAADAYYRHEVIGYNYRMPELTAAVALAQLEDLEEEVRRRSALAAEYHHRLELRGVRFQTADLGYTIPARWAMAVRIDADLSNPSRPGAVAAAALKARNVETRTMFPPVQSQPCYGWLRNVINGIETPVADSLGRRGLMLPLHGRMTKADVERACVELGDILGGGR